MTKGFLRTSQMNLIVEVHSAVWSVVFLLFMFAATQFLVRSGFPDSQTPPLTSLFTAHHPWAELQPWSAPDVQNIPGSTVSFGNVCPFISQNDSKIIGMLLWRRAYCF
jgi:hypothetical protein